MRCEYGFCLCCDKKILDDCPTCGSKRKTGDYTEVLLDLTNGSKMPIAVCLGCKDSVYHEDKIKVMQAVRDGWRREHDKLRWTPEQREQYWAVHGEGVLEIA